MSKDGNKIRNSTNSKKSYMAENTVYFPVERNNFLNVKNLPESPLQKNHIRNQTINVKPFKPQK